MNSFLYNVTNNSQAIVTIVPTIVVDTPVVVVNGNISFYINNILIGSITQTQNFIYDFGSAGTFTLSAIYRDQLGLISDEKQIQVVINLYKPFISLPPIAIQTLGVPFSIQAIDINLAGALDATVIWIVRDSLNVIVNQFRIENVTSLVDTLFSYTFSKYGVYTLECSIDNGQDVYTTKTTVQVSPYWSIRKLETGAYQIFNFVDTRFTYQIFNSSEKLVKSGELASRSVLDLNLKSGAYKVIVNNEQVIIYVFQNILENVKSLALSIVCSEDHKTNCYCSKHIDLCQASTVFHMHRLLAPEIRYSDQVNAVRFDDFERLAKTEKQMKTLFNLLNKIQNA